MWKTLIAGRDDVKLEDIELFNNHLVYEEREMGQTRITIRDLRNQQEQVLLLMTQLTWFLAMVIVS